MDLVDCINYANEVGSSNVYWQWDQQKRDEFKQYRTAMNARNNTSTAPAIDEEEEDDNGDTSSECEPEVAFEPEEEQEQESAAARTDVQEGGSVEPQQQQQQPAARKKNSRWIEYTQIAREELKQSTGKSKVPQKQVFALARQYYVEDGWAK